MTGPADRRIGLGWALEEFEALLATWSGADEQPDDIDDLTGFSFPDHRTARPCTPTATRPLPPKPINKTLLSTFRWSPSAPTRERFRRCSATDFVSQAVSEKRTSARPESSGDHSFAPTRTNDRHRLTTFCLPPNRTAFLSISVRVSKASSVNP